MSVEEDYTPTQRLCHEVRILLALADLEERDGDDTTGMYEYHRVRVGDLVSEVEKSEKAA